MSVSTIGIKVADGSYYPVIDVDFRGTRRLVLTTSKDNQQKVQVDLYRGNGSSVADVRYIGSLFIDNIPPASQGEPEIELLIAINDEGQLSAEAYDKSTGERQRFDTSLSSLPESEAFAPPEFSLEGESRETVFEEAPLTGEDYPIGERDRREEAVHRHGPNILLLVLFVVLGVALVGAIAFFVYRAISGPAIPPLPADAAAPAAHAAPAPGAAAAPAPTPAAAPAPASPAPAPAAAAGAVTYRIKKGDTLWDISATYYRNPWLYPKLARANFISNPDLIFAGTQITIPQD